MLGPDIVVLEGGYSIEGGLPYVNVGILLALAGLDYSHVKEPVPQPTQPPQVMGQIERITETVMRAWATRDQVDRSRLFGEGEYFQRHRAIYYDTDNLLEEQRELIRLCPDCSGWRLIYSKASGYYSSLTSRGQIAAVVIPWLACPKCRAEAENKYELIAKEGRCRQVFLQDVARDAFTNWRK
jgi:hypothetical protein